MQSSSSVFIIVITIITIGIIIARVVIPRVVWCRSPTLTRKRRAQFSQWRGDGERRPLLCLYRTSNLTGRTCGRCARRLDPNRIPLSRCIFPIVQRVIVY
jgi:hypothetical protein